MATNIMVRHRFGAIGAAFCLVLATAALVSGDERVQTPVVDTPAVVLLEDEEEDEAARLEDDAEDAEDAAELAAELAEVEAERAVEALENGNDDCVSAEEGTHGATVCAAAQAWKTSGESTPPEDQGEIVSSVARENPGAEIAAQQGLNGGLPDAARDALAGAGPTGEGPPGGGEEEEEE